MNRRDRHPHAVRNKYTFVWLPLIILGAFPDVARDLRDHPVRRAKYGGSQAPIWYFFALGIMSLSYTFRSRRR
jgi:hypothetical protein